MKNQCSNNQRWLVYLPFLGTIGYLLYLLFSKQYYTKRCLLSLAKSCLAVFILGIVLGLIGLLSHTISTVISLVFMGLFMNIIFFQSYTNVKNK